MDKIKKVKEDIELQHAILLELQNRIKKHRKKLMNLIEIRDNLTKNLEK